jgi:AraC-like DNA-binding protein
MSELRDLLLRHCQSEVTATAVRRLTLSRSETTTKLSAVIYYPLLCVVAQGRKRIFLGDEELEYNPSTYLVASIDLPVTGQVIEAPYLGCTLALDPGVLTELLLDMPSIAGDRTVCTAMEVNRLEDDLLDPLLRLMRLLDRPQDIPVLAPLFEREILYRLLRGPQGEMLRQSARPDSRLSQISRAIHLIRRRYDEPLRIEELARFAGMSATSFHRHFRAVTAMSPLQFQKQVRLQEARRLLLARSADAARISFEVGYESPSQFSREYRRLFGAPPVRDTARAQRTLRPANAER